jgi:leucine-rich repeat kinase 2
VEPDRLEALWPHTLQEGESQLRRYFTFDFLPNGFFSRLLVRLLSATSWLPQHFWKNGVLVRLDGARMLLLFDPRSNCLQLAVRGSTPGKHIAAMVESLDALCQDWLREPYESFVPCAHCLDEQSKEPFLFSLRDLERAAATDQVAVFCRGITAVSVSLLVPDIAMHSFEDCTVEFDEIEMGEELGVGGYAVVLLGKFQGQEVAVKKLVLPEAATEEQMEQIVAVFQEFRREAQLMSSMQHPNVVGLLGVVRDPLCLVLELMDLGSLHDVLHDDSRILDWRTKLSFANDVAKGMAYLHRFKLIHRDLKSPNVLVKKDDSVDVGVCAKIADFGLTRKMELTDVLNTKAVDNPVWLAPEILTKQKYTEMVGVCGSFVLSLLLSSSSLFFFSLLSSSLFSLSQL